MTLLDIWRVFTSFARAQFFLCQVYAQFWTRFVRLSALVSRSTLMMSWSVFEASGALIFCCRLAQFWQIFWGLCSTREHAQQVVAASMAAVGADLRVLTIGFFFKL